MGFFKILTTRKDYFFPFGKVAIVRRGRTLISVFMLQSVVFYIFIFKIELFLFGFHT